MSLKDILIFVKTYPEISKKYTETVCTGGILADTMQLVRLYPIRFRYLEGDKKFLKYQWIKAKISKAHSDPRPESHTIVESTIELGGIIPPDKDWSERRKWIINDNNLFDSMKKLHEAQKKNGTSLGIIKPKGPVSLHFEERQASDVESAIRKKHSIISQLDLFEEKKDLYIMPMRFILKFHCNESECPGHAMSILDWEIGQLYRKLRSHRDWKHKMEEKIIGEIFNENRDAYIILGNMANWQNIFCVLGFFWPPKQYQMRLLEL